MTPDPRFTRRALFVGAGMGAVGITLAGRMAYLSVWQGAKYAAQAEGNRVSLRLIPPRRGWIVDRAGKPLALNAPDYRVELLPDQVKDFDATLAAIGMSCRSPSTTSRAFAAISPVSRNICRSRSPTASTGRPSPGSTSTCPAFPVSPRSRVSPGSTPAAMPSPTCSAMSEHRPPSNSRLSATRC